MSDSNYNLETIKKFGEYHLDMDIDSPSRFIDARMGKLFTYLDLQYIKRWVLSEIDFKSIENFSILDVGAGKGRITRHFFTIAKQIVAIEPFEPFFKVLLNLDIPPNTNVKLLNLTLSQYKKITDSKFDFIFTAGVTPYINDNEINEFFNNLGSLVKKSGVILVRDFCVEDQYSGDGPYGSIKSDLEIIRSPSGLMKIFKTNNLHCLKFRRAYPVVLPWVIYKKWPNKFTDALWEFTSLNIFHLFYYKLAEINLPHKRCSFYMFLLKLI